MKFLLISFCSFVEFAHIFYLLVLIYSILLSCSSSGFSKRSSSFLSFNSATVKVLFLFSLFLKLLTVDKGCRWLDSNPGPDPFKIIHRNPGFKSSDWLLKIYQPIRMLKMVAQSTILCRNHCKCIRHFRQSISHLSHVLYVLGYI